MGEVVLRSDGAMEAGYVVLGVRVPNAGMLTVISGLGRSPSPSDELEATPVPDTAGSIGVDKL